MPDGVSRLFWFSLSTEYGVVACTTKYLQVWWYSVLAGACFPRRSGLQVQNLSTADERYYWG